MIDDWLVRFGSTFQEYRIRGVTFDINAVDDMDGLTMFSISEDDFGQPTYNSMFSATNWLVPNNSSNPRSRKVVRWKAIDLDNLQYLSITTASSVASLNWFTDNTTFNTPFGLRMFLIRPVAQIEFRGIGEQIA